MRVVRNNKSTVIIDQPLALFPSLTRFSKIKVRTRNLCGDACEWTGRENACTNFIFLGLQIWDIILDFLGGAELINSGRSKNADWGYVLIGVTSVMSIVLLLSVLGVTKGGEYTGFGFAVRVFLEDSTSLIIMLTVRGAFDGTVVDHLNLYTTIVYAFLAVFATCFVACGGDKDDDDDDDDDDSRNNDNNNAAGGLFSCCGFLLARQVALGFTIAAGVFVAMGDFMFDDEPGIFFLAYLVMVLIGVCSLCTTFCDGQFDGERTAEGVGCFSILVAIFAIYYHARMEHDRNFRATQTLAHPPPEDTSENKREPHCLRMVVYRLERR